MKKIGYYLRSVLILAMMMFIMVASTPIMDRMVATFCGIVPVLSVNLLVLM